MELSEANFHDAVKQQLDEELRMENDRKLLYKDDTPDNDNDDEEDCVVDVDNLKILLMMMMIVMVML